MNRRSLLAMGAMLLALPNMAFAAAPTRFAVKVTGNGPDVILVPGLTCPGEVWDDTAARLSRTHRVHVLTVAGYGTPAGPNAEGPILAPLVEELAQYIRDEGLKSPALIGHSVGGTIGQMLAIRHPSALGRLLIVDAFPFTGLMFNPNGTSEQVEPNLRAYRDQFLAVTEEAYDAAQPPAMRRYVRSQEAYEKTLRWATVADRRVVLQKTYEAGILDMRPQIIQIKIPVTVFYAFDASLGAPLSLIEPVWIAAYASRPGTVMKRFDDSRHFIMLDQPERFAREVDAFLA